MFITSRRRGGLGRWRGRGMGLVATPVNGSLVASSDPVRGTIRRPAPYRPTPVVPINSVQPQPIVSPLWGSNPISSRMPVQTPGWSAGSSPYGSTPQNPTNSQALAAAQALLATNPSLLSPQQFQMLQAAGLVSNTLPYASVSQITPSTPITSPLSTGNDPNCVAMGCTGGPYPNCTCAAAATTSSFDIGTMLSTAYLGLPLYVWLVGGVGAYLLLGHKGGRR